MANEEPGPSYPPPSPTARDRFSVIGSTSGDPIEGTWAIILVVITYPICVTALLLAFGFLDPPNLMGAISVITGTCVAFIVAIHFLIQ